MNCNPTNKNVSLGRAIVDKQVEENKKILRRVKVFRNARIFMEMHENPHTLTEMHAFYGNAIE